MEVLSLSWSQCQRQRTRRDARLLMQNDNQMHACVFVCVWFVCGVCVYVSVGLLLCIRMLCTCTHAGTSKCVSDSGEATDGDNDHPVHCQ